MKLCSGIGCKKSAIARGFCSTHWRRWRTHGDPEKTLSKTGCSEKDCLGKHYARGMCSRHFNKLRRQHGYFVKKECTPKYRFASCLRYSKSRNLEWSIPFESYERLISKNCDYCEGPLPPTRVGLDRKNNDLGYTLENVVPCCRYCNQLKSDIFTYEEFKLFSNTSLFKTILNRLHNKITSQLQEKKNNFISKIV